MYLKSKKSTIVRTLENHCTSGPQYCLDCGTACSSDCTAACSGCSFDCVLGCRTTCTGTAGPVYQV